MSTIGGGIIRDYNFSQAWGVNPSAASGTALIDILGGPGGAFGIGVGDYVNFAFGGVASFLGIISEASESQEFGQGRTQTFQVVDNRVRLGWQMVFACYNIEDDVAGKILHRSIDGSAVSPVEVWKTRRRYKHLLPENWAKGEWTFTTEPMTAGQVLTSAFGGAWGDYSFGHTYHPSLTSAIFLGLDWSTGIKLSNLVSEINGKAGLEVGLIGERTLKWVRKGVGIIPLPDASCTARASGLSLTSNDNRIRVVGERIRVQVVNLELEPDWQSGWEAWIDELAWNREVATTFSMPSSTKSDQCEIAAFSRSVTVYEFAKKKNDVSLLDPRNFGRVSRNFIPAWIYIRELIYRSYRIPGDFTLHGIPLSSLDICDSLLAGVDIAGEGAAAKQIYATEPVQFYPSTQAAVIVRGQPLDLINARDIRLFYRNSTGDLRNEWTAAPDVEVDCVGKSIRVGAPWFIDGLPSEGKSIYLRVNRGEGGEADLSELVEADSDLLDIVVPNPDFELTAAEVKASFTFLLGRFFRDYGSGRRCGSLVSSGLDLHVLDLTATNSFAPPGTASIGSGILPFTGVSCRELLYEDGGSAVEKAAEIADSVIHLDEIQATGGFTRHGFAGTQLSPVVDRVTVAVTFSGGITEQVEYTKARASSAAFSERTLQRMQRSEELFAGQEAMKREIREYQLIAAAERKPARSRRARTHNHLSEVFEKPVGCENVSVQKVTDKNAAAPTRAPGDPRWKAGDLCWLDAAGYPTQTGGTFGGVVVATPNAGESLTNKELYLAYTGRVPVRVTSGLPVNSPVRADPGGHRGSATGSVTIGRLAHGAALPASSSGECFAMVDLGSGGGGEAFIGPCNFGEIIQYSADGSDSGSGEEAKTGIGGGGIEAGNIWKMPPYEINLAVDGKRIVWIRIPVVVNLTPLGDATMSGIASSTAPSWESIAYDSDSDVPVTFGDKRVPPIFPAGDGVGVDIVLIGTVTVESGSATLARSGCGDIIATHCPGNLSHRRGYVGFSDSSV
jgi:hypothetical protein